MYYLSAARTASLPATLRTMFDCVVSIPSEDFGSPIINSSASYNLETVLWYLYGYKIYLYLSNFMYCTGQMMNPDLLFGNVHNLEFEFLSSKFQNLKQIQDYKDER
jgi:hypothetical protein